MTIQIPHELYREWWKEGNRLHRGAAGQASLAAFFVSSKAAEYAADQELEACCEWLRDENWTTSLLNMLRAARRPKPPSLKQQALEALMHLENGAHHSMDTTESVYRIRRALESIPDADS